MTLGLEDGRLVEHDFALTSPISPADLEGTSWQLLSLDDDETPLPDGVTVTAVFSGSELSGSAGCNRYTAALGSDDPRPNALTVTAISSTDMLCDDPVMAAETAFLSHLALVESWTFNNGRLALTTVTDGPTYHQLRFAPAQPATP